MTAGTGTASTRWAGTGDWTQTITLDTVARTATIALLSAAWADHLLLDQVVWTRPVRLAVGAAGALFQGEAGPEVHGYVVTGATTLHTPAVQRHQPFDLGTPRQADMTFHYGFVVSGARRIDVIMVGARTKRDDRCVRAPSTSVLREGDTGNGERQPCQDTGVSYRSVERPPW